MKRRYLVFSFVLFGVVAVWLVVYSSSPREPVYLKRPLGAWLDQLQSPDIHEREDAIDALRAIGTKALPLYDEMFRKPQPAYKEWLIKTARKQRLIRFRAHTQDERMALARQGFDILGPKAAVAVPEIAIVLKDKSRTARIAALDLLLTLGPEAKEAVPALSATLTDSDLMIRVRAIACLGKIGTNAQAAIPFLLRALKDKDPYFRRGAIWALHETKGEPGRIVPALAEMLRDQDAGVRRYAANAFSNWGPVGKAAVPALLQARQDKDEQVRRYIEKALHKMGDGTSEKTEAP